MAPSGDDDSSERGAQLLAGAYALSTPDDHLGYYREFAAHYDTVFADGLGYVYPAAIAACLAKSDIAPDESLLAGPILDIGCGTGLVAAEISALIPGAVIDGIDISPEMLDVARDKGLYRNLLQADLTADFSHLSTDYTVMVSAGTFTHGHLGPDPLAGLLAHCVSGAMAVIGVNSLHYKTHNFADTLARLEADNRISTPRFDEVPIYDGRDASDTASDATSHAASHAASHAGDTAFILSFSVT